MARSRSHSDIDRGKPNTPNPYKVDTKNRRPDEAGAVPAEFTERYADMVQQCWQKEPSQRPEMQQVTTALKEILDSLLVQLFHDTDLDGDGLMSLSELTTKLISPEYAFTEVQIQHKFAQYDKAGSGQLNQGQAINLFKNLYAN